MVGAPDGWGVGLGGPIEMAAEPVGPPPPGCRVSRGWEASEPWPVGAGDEVVGVVEVGGVEVGVVEAGVVEAGVVDVGGVVVVVGVPDVVVVVPDVVVVVDDGPPEPPGVVAAPPGVAPDAPTGVGPGVGTVAPATAGAARAIRAAAAAMETTSRRLIDVAKSGPPQKSFEPTDQSVCQCRAHPGRLNSSQPCGPSPAGTSA